MDINELIDKEKYLECDDICIDCHNLWMINRYSFRVKYLNEITKTSSVKFKFFKIAYFFFVSIVQFSLLFIMRNKYSNIIFPHPRRFLFQGKYIERLTDPVIELSDLGNNSLVVELPQNGIHNIPRYSNNKVLFFDSVLIFYTLFSSFYIKRIKLKHRKQFFQLYNEIGKHFDIDSSYMDLFYKETARFIFLYKTYSWLLSVTKPQRVFLAPRAGFFASLIPAAKNRSIPVYEFQHGITLGQTILYGGVYDEYYDPDYFLAFGEANIGTQFRMPLERIINIGWAYKKLINDTLENNLHADNVILVISEPHITSIIIDNLLVLSSLNQNLEFHLRLHPQESISAKDLGRLNCNVILVDNTEESFVVLSKYRTIIGENSSVLFEALSMNKKVGRLSFNGLLVMDNGFYGGEIIKSIEQFDAFVARPYVRPYNVLEYYSNFRPDIINKL